MFSGQVSAEKIFHIWSEKLRIRLHILLRLSIKPREQELYMSEAGKDARKLLNFFWQMAISADFYHAGLPDELRDKKQTSWTAGEIKGHCCNKCIRTRN